MKCLYCDKKMIYKPNMRGYINSSMYGMKGDYNAVVVDYTENVEEDYIITKLKRKRTKTLSINLKYYVCPKCGQVLTKIPDEFIDFVVNSER